VLAAGRLVVAPGDARLRDEGVGVPLEQRQGLGLVVGQRRDGQVSGSHRQAGDPLKGRHGLPLHAGGAEQRVGLAAHAQRQRARIRRGVQALTSNWQTHPQVTARQADGGKRMTARHRGAHVVLTLRHGHVDRPVVPIRQLGLAGLEGDR
jgi:hypothetical protein